MRVLVACEFSGVVRETFLKRGHDAYSCDLLPCDNEPSYSVQHPRARHYQCDVHLMLHDGYNPRWDLIIAHPPCTYLCSSGLHWNKRIPGRADETEKALEFVRELMEADADKICIENPIGCISTRIRKYDQAIQPYQFGHDASKTTCLWLKNLPKLVPTGYVEPRIIGNKLRWANQTDSGQNRLGPSADRWALRSITYQGIADAMADQWGGEHA